MDRLGKNGDNYTKLQTAMKLRLTEVKARQKLNKNDIEQVANLTRDIKENQQKPYANWMAVKVKGGNEQEERKIKAEAEHL